MIQKRPNKQVESDEEGVGKNLANTMDPKRPGAEEEKKTLQQ